MQTVQGKFFWLNKTNVCWIESSDRSKNILLRSHDVSLEEILTHITAEISRSIPNNYDLESDFHYDGLDIEIDAEVHTLENNTHFKAQITQSTAAILRYRGFAFYFRAARLPIQDELDTLRPMKVFTLTPNKSSVKVILQGKLVSDTGSNFLYIPDFEHPNFHIDIVGSFNQHLYFALGPKMTKGYGYHEDVIISGEVSYSSETGQFFFSQISKLCIIKKFCHVVWPGE